MRALAVLLLALLLLPSAAAHIQGARPSIQPSERDRIIGLGSDGLGYRAELSLLGDPLRQSVVHVVDPTTGLFSVEHRPDGSRDEERFHASWRIERLVEYRDANMNGRYEPQIDSALKAWRLTHYQWRREPVQRAQVADVQGNDIVWEGNLTGSPHLRAEVVIAGLPFVDEGALVRPQDVILYLDLTDLPTRTVGALHALEITVTTQEANAFQLFEAENTTTAIVADAPDGRRRAMLVWGGEALLDETEHRLDATLTGERVTDAGERTALLTLHMPTVDDAMRFVMVSAVEYLSEDKRAPAPWTYALLAAAMVALASRRRRLA